LRSLRSSEDWWPQWRCERKIGSLALTTTKRTNDDHQWNAHEDRAYHMYAKDNHRKYGNFSKQKDNDQQAYWAWRHDHSDALLKIEIR
jgi:hypothetical protein